MESAGERAAARTQRFGAAGWSCATVMRRGSTRRRSFGAVTWRRLRPRRTSGRDLITVFGKVLVQESVIEPHDPLFRDGCNRKGPRPRDKRIVLRVGDLMQMLTTMITAAQQRIRTRLDRRLKSGPPREGERSEATHLSIIIKVAFTEQEER